MNLPRKYKYGLLSVGTVISLFLFSYSTGFLKQFSAILAVSVAVLGTALVQYTSVTSELATAFFIRKTWFNVLILPLTLVLGALLSLHFFPNLGLPTKVITIGAVGGLIYAMSLVTNIFLVVYERQEAIPLYRVAVTWSQILLIVVSIPFFSGVFKLPMNSIFQALVAALVSGLFAKFLMWVQEMDPDVPEIDRGEKLVNSGLISFVVFAFSISTSFFPAESFLRSLLVSSVLMSSLGYLLAHYKNAVTKRLIAEYYFITAIFLSFVLIFH